MKNIVELEYRNKTYRAENGINPKFYTALLQLLESGYYPDIYQFDSVSRILSLHPTFSGNTPFDYNLDMVDPLPLSSVAIFAFTKKDSGLRFLNSSISSEEVGFPVEYFDFDGVNTYSLTAINNQSFALSQSFYYSPTAEEVSTVFEIESFATKTNFLRRESSLTSFVLDFLPFTYISTEKLIGKPRIELHPAESFKITWLVDFNFESDSESTFLKSSINNVNAEIHEQFKIILSDIMSSTGYIFPGTASGDASLLKITGIIAFRDSEGALYNSSTTTNKTAFFVEPDITLFASEAISSTGDTIITYSVNYTNKTGVPQQIGSLLLSGYRVNDVRSIVPIAWISAKDLWGVNERIVNPRERLKLTWSVRINPPKLINVALQQ